MPLGLMPGSHYEEKEVTIEPGRSSCSRATASPRRTTPTARCSAARASSTSSSAHSRDEDLRDARPRGARPLHRSRLGARGRHHDGHARAHAARGGRLRAQRRTVGVTNETRSSSSTLPSEPGQRAPRDGSASPTRSRAARPRRDEAREGEDRRRRGDDERDRARQQERPGPAGHDLGHRVGRRAAHPDHRPRRRRGDPGEDGAGPRREARAASRRRGGGGCS